MRGDTSCDMSNKRNRVLPHFQKSRGELKIQRTVENFWRTYVVTHCLKCLKYIFRGSYNQGENTVMVMISSVYTVEYCERNPRTQRKTGEVNRRLNRWFSCGSCCALLSILYQLLSRIFSAFLSKIAFVKGHHFWIRIAGRAWERDCMLIGRIRVVFRLL